MSPESDLALLLRTLAFAARKHRHQRRKDVRSLPYINHPIALAHVLYSEGGISDINVLCAAILHDTLEDTSTTRAELAEHFGEQIRDIVVEVTDDKRLSKRERKRLQIEHAAQLSPASKLVKLADKICNLRDVLASPPVGWSRSRKREYFEWAKQVVDGLRGSNRALETVFDEVCSQIPTPVHLPNPANIVRRLFSRNRPR
ncbi:MAG: bifunctional (p)ppGpp synthetase/guanosine-3',5'-bis(diphosphate) 3'-pyrophosphohydrolase [Candidatus Zixiibacteriota bacterium]|nr:MAG: bifunctional (p)ppGpp synthetase/guanosine-3',5'-bis(diphosphate) 3'-pyrophosphohydrolase [candidate division Zixibacteria bacterium]